MLTNINIVPFVCVCVRALVSIMCVHMQDCLPVCLMFDMREEGEPDPRRLNQMMQALEVFISIKPKPKQPSKVHSLTHARTHTPTHSLTHSPTLFSIC